MKISSKNQLANIMIVTGQSGVGKSTLLKLVSEKYHMSGKATFIKRFITREKRINEDENNFELDFISNSKFNLFEKNDEYGKFYSSKYGKSRYGFWQYKLTEALNKFMNVFVIVSNPSMANELLNDFGEKHKIIQIYLNVRNDLVMKRLRNEGFSEADIEKRVSRPNLMKDYCTLNEINHEIIWNDGDSFQLESILDDILEKYTN